MKKILLIALLGFCIMANAQPSAGVKLNIGIGGISSSNLEKNLDYQRNYNSKITEWSVSNRWGLDIGFGVFAAYDFAENVCLRGEPVCDLLKGGSDFNRVENKGDAGGDGDVNTHLMKSDIN